MIPPPSPYSFHDAFWTSSTQFDCLPKFSHGLSVLHTKLAQSMEENKVIIDYLQRRILSEKQFAQQLQASMDDNKMQDIFDCDMGGSLKQCFQVVQTESKLSAEAHLSRATNLTTTALDPVERMAAKYTKIITSSKTAMTTCISQFDAQARITNQSHQDYIDKCKKILAYSPYYHPNQDSPVILANKTWTRNDLNLLLDRLEQTYHPLLGQNILDEMTPYYHSSNNDNNNNNNNNNMDNNSSVQNAVMACQQLFTQGWITASSTKITGDHALQHGENDTSHSLKQFSTSADIEYTVQRQYQVNTNDTLSTENSSTNGSAPTTTSSTSTTSTSASASSLGFWSRRRWASSTTITTKQIDTHQQLYHDMQQADELYKKSVQALDTLRMEVEENLFMHFEEMESLELERIQTLKQAFISMAAAFSNTIPIYKEIYDRMMLYQETLRPEKDVQSIVEQYRTGRFCPRPILYENYFSGTASDQMFGVPLEDIVKKEQAQIPMLIHNGLEVIEAELPQLCDEERQKIWTTPLPLDLIHKARNELNTLNSIDQTTLKSYNLLLLSSVLRLYLLELPDCLVTSELYDTLKVLYASQMQQDTDSHLRSIGKLMTTLPSANYETLKALLFHFQRVMTMTNDKTLLQTLISRFTHIIIRPDVITTSNRHDRHPHRFVRDLMEHMDIIFSKEMHQAQTDHHLRQQQQRIIGSAMTTYSHRSSLEIKTKLPSLDTSSMTSTLSASYPHSEEIFTTESQHSKDIDSHHDLTPSLLTDISPPVPRRSLMSFMRRSSNVENGTGQRHTTDGGTNNVSRRPIPMPSSSTLFEDPEEIDLTPCHPVVSPTSIPNGTTPSTRISPSISLDDDDDDDDDDISLDSFL
ncbi:uncharacterized protein BX664DRAFT_335319 [Halteromyces radiatus]|uniref:uncharacterized protein n=1 Tax=Halteromyces radiatus TaxID=101107 RepID=UPI002220B299|nr:uncharacterized protein BX664DRAFT_335319 [Halteromyces radiatus]KAI8086251.1 hypothetical protein BX664DRAFT_335319 [Halteromyces radiatus]